MNDFEIIQSGINSFKKDRRIETIKIGKSTLGEMMYAFHKGSYTSPQILITGGIHAREYISSLVVTNLIFDWDMEYGCYFVPLVNPDGARLCTCGDYFIKDEDYKAMLQRLNKNSTNFNKWKANIRGVDLNQNFDAGWGKSKFCSVIPGSSGFCGESVNSEIETKNIQNFIGGINIQLSFCYHSKGKVVYYGYEKLAKDILQKEKFMAKTLCKVLKYKKIRSIGSTGGLGDYIGYRLGIPSVTIELGSDRYCHPIPCDMIKRIYKNQYKALKICVQRYYDRFTQ